jgi:hypothetical protein
MLTFLPCTDLKSAKFDQPMSPATQNNSTPESETRGKFTFFPKLPLELRLKIWATTFKKQHVDLDIQKFWKRYPNRSYGLERPRLLRPIFPVALHVNRESRFETLRHYCIISTSDRRTRPPICVNLSLDSCFFDHTLVHSQSIASYYTSWLSRLDSNAPRGLKSLRELEIGDICWHAVCKYEVENEKSANHPQYPGRLFYLRALQVILRFSGLQQVTFTWTERYSNLHMTASDFVNMKDCRETIQKYMERHKNAFLGGKVPEIKVRRWVKEEKAFACSTRDGEKVWEKIEY